MKPKQVIRVITGVVLVAHGSRIEAAVEEVRSLAEQLEALDTYGVVQYGFLELAGPDIPSAIDIVIKKGAQRVVVIPFFLLEGSHVLEDLPELIRDAREKNPTVEIRLAKSLGNHPVLSDIFVDRASKLLGK